MRYMSFGMLVVVSMIALAGCAGMSEQACLATDWRSVGFEDGVAGRTVGNIASYRQSCGRHGIAPDLDQYRAGHDQGVRLYCRAGNGFEVGRRGSRYQGVCPADLEVDFLAAYNDGRQLYELESALRSVEREISARHAHSAQLKKDIVAASATIVADETTSEQRAQLLIDIAAMSAEQVQIADEVEQLEAERALRESDLLAYRETLAFAF